MIRPSSRTAVTLALSAALTLLSACTERAAPAAPRVATNVLVVTIDTLRADRVGVYGATNVETPNMDRLAREGAWAPQADAPVPLTRPSHVSLFTGRYPSEHGLRDNLSAPLGDDVPLLAGIFQQAGFATAAFVASSVLDRQSGLARGFDVYSDRFEGGADQRTGDAVTGEAIGWLRSPPSKPKFFAWVHLYDPHAPYTPPEPYATRYAGRPYDGEVAWCDELVGRMIGALRDAGHLNDTLIIVTSDHGEALGEHGEDVHGYFVYEATLRVPLILRGPGVTPGTRLGTVARTIDLFPTILDLMGVGAGQASSGRSLAPSLRGAQLTDEPAFAESLVPLLHYGWSDLRSVRDGRWKYILAPRPELYDLDSDPGELRNLAGEQQTRAQAMRSGIEAHLAKERASPRKPGDTSGISPDLLERLGSLGYVSPGGPVDKKSAGADPKDKLDEYKALSGLMQQALVAMRAGRAADAVQQLREVGRRGLDSYELHFYLGRAYAAGQHWREAVVEYEKATAKFPAGVEAWRGLGEGRVALHDSRGAIRAFETLVSIAPQDPMALMQLGEAYRDLGRWDEATRTIQRALTIDPGPAQYWNSLGTVLGSGRKMAEAEHAFGEAVKREPANGLYRYNHGLALQQLGRRDEAMAEFHQAAVLGYRGQ